MFTITYLGVEQPAAAWGLTADPRLSLPKSRAKKFTWKMAGADPAGTIPFPFEAAVTINLYDGAAGVGTFGNLLWQFQGRQTTEQGVAIPGQRGIFLVFEDTWYDLENTPFQQLWNINGGGTINFARYYLFQDLSTPLPGYLTVAQQITQVIQWAQGCGVNIQPGTIRGSSAPANMALNPLDGTSQMPWYPARGLSCAAVIEKCLTCFPDYYTWIDDSTTPPAFNMRAWADLVPVTMQWSGTDAAGRQHKTSKLTPLYKLQPSQVVLQYQEVNTANGVSAPEWQYDTWPAGSTGKARRALVVPIDLRGSQSTDTTLKETWTVAGFNPNSLDFWSGNHGTGQIGKVAALGKPDISNLAFADAYICLSAADDLAHPNGISITDAAGNYYGLAGLNEHKKGTLTSWLTAAFGSPVTLTEVTVKASFSYTKNRKIGATTMSQAVLNAHNHVSNVKLTTVPVGVTEFTLSGIDAYSSGESPTPNLAQNIFNSLNQLQHDGTHEVNTQISPLNPQPIIGSWNTLTLLGGRPDWTAMNIASVDIDFHGGAATAQQWIHTTITLGPARHLSPQDQNNYLQFFRARIVEDNGKLRSGGVVANSALVDMGGEQSKQDTVPGQPDQSFGSFNFVDSGPGGSGNTFSFQHDASQQTISYVEYNPAGAQLGKAQICRLFPSLSAMAAGTQAAGVLPAIVRYQMYDLVVDESNNSLWLCTIAGTPTASTWAQISGGGGGGASGAVEYSFVSDSADGDFIICNPGPIYIKKPYKIRVSLTGETIRGVAHAYTYAPARVANSKTAVAYYTRTDSYSSTTEAQIIIPDYVVGNLVYAIPFVGANPPPATVLTAVVSNGGTAGTYAVNDVLLVFGGTLLAGSPASLKVTSVAAGKITGITVVDGGLYTVPPSVSNCPAAGGGGTGATFNLTLSAQMLDINADGRAWAS